MKKILFLCGILCLLSFELKTQESINVKKGKAIMRDVVVILFNDFETLDVFGPIEVLGRLVDHFNLNCYSIEGGIITSSQKVQIKTRPLSELHSDSYVLIIPGGVGVRNMIRDSLFVKKITELSQDAEYVLTICTGSILLSKTGLLDGKRATSNKRVFFWTSKESPSVQWIKKARWVRDGKFYTSSGVSAGIDMTFGFISDLFGRELAKQQSNEIEYNWEENPEHDPFSELY
jgi:transcriptional regulator GlxA family with amidase domain